MNKDHGGPAFPVPLNPGEPYQEHLPFDGMTLRDYFAAKAMQAFLHPTYVETNATKPHSRPLFDVTEAAYRYADAMLKARKEGGGE
ncbi:TPA: hypothetical protein L3631_006796 [Pseudomonas aeruginosa]|nr:hypothetical protein [Pseudomonas aeruginosa]HBN7779160.1 hypothetical protein [Pseudomonas aeruginosa]HBN7805051.1 hypothetical protein [Pseudomonas aeruginosa]HBN7839261.1 hypothetical protein [Pseudomonas aeruginosa]HBN7861315.1 hypothetical protein [Pseudomonas aeruginosa]